MLTKIRSVNTYQWLIAVLACITLLLLTNVVLLTSGLLSNLPSEWTGGRVLLWRFDVALSVTALLLLITVLALMRHQRQLFERQQIAMKRCINVQTTHLRLLQDVALGANESDMIDGALQFALDVVCAHTGWPLAHVYLAADELGQEFIPSNIWHDEDAQHFAPFKHIAEQTNFRRGAGTVGVVLAPRKAEWIADLSRDADATRLPSAAMASDVGIRAAFAFPVRANKAIEFECQMSNGHRHDYEARLVVGGSLGSIAGGSTGQIPPQGEAMIESAYKNSRQRVRLLNDILAIEKIESGKLVFDLKPLDLLALIAQAIESHHAYGEQFGVRFALHSILHGVKVNGDADRLTQVVSNLLSHAATFAPRGSEVVVSLTLRDGEVRLSVSDQGAGIPDEFRARSVEQFAQADPSTTRQKGGRGLDFSTAKAIIETHGGQIAFESEVGSGTTFCFDLPVWHEPELYIELPLDEHLETLRDPHPCILVCEDDREIAMLISLMLHDFSVDVAHSAREAKQLLAQRAYAAMTLDLLLPDQDGISLIRELRQQSTTRHLPIVVVSASAEQGRVELNGEAFLIVDWLAKPIHQAQLLDAVTEATRITTGRKPRILHVENADDVANVVQHFLADIAEVVQAQTQHAAMQRVTHELFDLILLDPALPAGCGLELLPLIHQAGKRLTPVVICSGPDLSPDLASNISARLVRSRTSNQELLDTIKHLTQPATVHAPPRVLEAVTT